MSVFPDRPWAVDKRGEFVAGFAEMFFLMAYQVARRQETLNDRLLKPLDLTATQWRVLVAIWRMKSGTMNELAARSAVERTTLTRMVDQLVARKLIQRVTPPEDRRQVRLTLTGEGEHVMDQGWSFISPSQRETLSDMDEDSVREAIRLMQAIVAKMTDRSPSLMEGLGIKVEDAS